MEPEGIEPSTVGLIGVGHSPESAPRWPAGESKWLSGFLLSEA